MRNSEASRRERERDFVTGFESLRIRSGIVQPYSPSLKKRRLKEG